MQWFVPLQLDFAPPTIQPFQEPSCLDLIMDYYGLREFDAKIFRGSREKLHASAVRFHLSEEKKVAPSALYGRSMHAD